MLTMKVHPVGNPDHHMIINEHDFDAKIHVRLPADAVPPPKAEPVKRRPVLVAPPAPEGSTPSTTSVPATPVVVSSHTKEEMLAFTHKALLELPEVKHIKSPSQKKADLVDQILAVRTPATS